MSKLRVKGQKNMRVGPAIFEQKKSYRSFWLVLVLASTAHSGEALWVWKKGRTCKGTCLD